MMINYITLSYSGELILNRNPSLIFKSLVNKIRIVEDFYLTKIPESNKLFEGTVANNDFRLRKTIEIFSRYSYLPLNISGIVYSHMDRNKTIIKFKVSISPMIKILILFLLSLVLFDFGLDSLLFFLFVYLFFGILLFIQVKQIEGFLINLD